MVMTLKYSVIHILHADNRNSLI